jgi:SAM-dependent methyltransferase
VSTRFEVPPGQHESLDRMADAGNYNDWLVDRSSPYVERRVLDFGAGIGTFTSALAPRSDVVAVEPDPQFVPRLRERFAGNDRVTVVAADAEWLLGGEPEGAFDTILCLNVLEHIRDDAAVLRGLRHRLAPGGHLLLLVPAHGALYGEIDRSVGHERRYSRARLRGVLRETGLEPVEMRYVNPVGAVGWLVSSRLLRRAQVPAGPLRAYDRLVPILRRMDRLPLPFGLSVWAVAQRARQEIDS